MLQTSQIRDTPAPPSPVQVAPLHTLAMRNVRWFDGKRFRHGDWYVNLQGRFTRKRPELVAETIDARGESMVPAYGDAHCHNFSHLNDLDRQTALYVRDGVLTAKSMTDPTSTGARAQAQLRAWGSPVAVAFAHAGLTGARSHPKEIYESIALGFHGQIPSGQYERVMSSNLEENDAYYVIDSLADLDTKWPRILAGKPDFLKVYLLSSEDYAEHRARGEGLGINPDVLPKVVRRAHAAGLRVSAHIETAYDFHVGVTAGIDEFTHMPAGFIPMDADPARYTIAPADAAAAARRHIDVVMTLFEGDVDPPDAAQRERNRAVIVRNIHTLQRAGVKLAAGYDGYNTDSAPEFALIHELGIFSNAALLRLWSGSTPQVIFPGRKLGRIAEGYEATFLLLRDDPLASFAATRTIAARYRQGRLITLDQARVARLLP